MIDTNRLMCSSHPQKNRMNYYELYSFPRSLTLFYCSYRAQYCNKTKTIIKMNKTTKTENVAYFAPDARSIITVANFIDTLIVQINMQKTVEDAAKNGLTPCDIIIPQFDVDIHDVGFANLKDVYDLLIEMGFVPTGKVDILPKGYGYHPRIVGNQWEDECDKPDASDNLPQSEEAMKQAEIASKSPIEDRESPTYNVELHAENISVEYANDLAQEITDKLYLEKGGGFYSEIVTGLLESSKDNVYVIHGLFYKTSRIIRNVVVNWNKTRGQHIEVFIKNN